MEKLQNRFIFTRPLLTLTLIFSAGILAFVLLFSLAWRGTAWLLSKIDDSPANQITEMNLPNDGVQIVGEEEAIINAVKKSAPAVVSIVASAEVPKLERCTGDDENSFFGYPRLCERGTEVQRVGAASGFIVSPEGHILTNKHVVADEKAEYTVILNTEEDLGKKVKATVLARDPNNDIAVLKINGKDLPHLEFGDSSKLQVGQTTIAIGYALGEFDNSVSRGVISGLSRSISAAGGRRIVRLRDLIQTDAAINPGNSGGPLLDISGNVIGMNVAMASAQSIGFAIPGNEAKTIFDQVKSTGKISEVERPFLGVRYVAVTRDLQLENNLPYDYGMFVSSSSSGQPAVVPGSPAEKGGIKNSNIILEADGRQLNEGYLLTDFIADHKPGDNVILKVYQDGRVNDLNITLGKI